ncbi:hypothetical protein K4K49_008959 [Colletotrichum sp. SAR 10_70]|nr:hypothetical protein K4K49_008959 [Colletotrichum sp. SAR 10_70]KAI8156389.1 hypothetical protein K4K50_005642 [Colletotrichum sp. SAR 10_71]KAI8174178.1 hypothetical protein K4K51_009010 [Colletotrichum sp. SAR 10_75]KAI8265098.1 hypothetical protein K4K58_011743 [Colletotrichum sp. SAR11_239]
MKFSFVALATLAVSVAASPVVQLSNTKTVTMKRDELLKSGLLNKRDKVDLAESVNYILVLLREGDDSADPYQDEVDAVADPSQVLG